MMKSVLVSHPHAASFATAVARTLEDAGLLAWYVTGVSAAAGDRKRILLRNAVSLRPQLRNRVLTGIPETRLRCQGGVELAARGATRLAALVKPNVKAYDAIFTLHDLVTAARPWPAGLDAVYAYEDGARFTFGAAARRGLGRLWDLPLPHWASLEQMWVQESGRWPGAMGEFPPIEPEWKKQRKEAELALADVVFVASRHTQASLEGVGCKKPIVVVPYGFPVDRFALKPRAAEGPFTVLSVGTHDLRKGTPYLLEAWRRAGLRDSKLRLLGPMRLTKQFLNRYSGMFEHVPHVPRTFLESEYQAADLLVFPTLGDGFGLVMQEAMCCGTPVATTRCGGGPECITDGHDGWLVPDRDTSRWVEFLRWASGNRDELRRAGAAARVRAERWTERDAGRLLVESLSRLGASRREG